MDQGEHFAARQRATDTSDETDGGIDEALEIETGDQRRHQQQPGIGHQVGLVEGHANPVDPARYWLHRKCLLVLGNATSNTAILPAREALSADARTSTRSYHRWIEALGYAGSDLG